jgi:hypothetical protein
MDEQRYARFARKRLRADGLPPTVSEPVKMHDDITPPILKNAVSLDGDGKPQIPRKERQVSEKAMPRNDQRWPAN